MTQKECVEHIQSIIENALKERGISDWNLYESSRIYRVLAHTIITLEISENEFIKIKFKILLEEDEFKVFVPQLQYTKNLDAWVHNAINKNMDLIVKTEKEYHEFITRKDFTLQRVQTNLIDPGGSEKSKITWVIKTLN